jgi:hypothetical protein
MMRGFEWQLIALVVVVMHQLVRARKIFAGIVVASQWVCVVDMVWEYKTFVCIDILSRFFTSLH